MNRDRYTFLSVTATALAYTHAAEALAASKGIMNANPFSAGADGP